MFKIARGPITEHALTYAGGKMLLDFSDKADTKAQNTAINTNDIPGELARVNMFFTITAEIHARSLANFYGQYAERHMNLKFMRRVSERARSIRQFIIVKNKLMSVFNESVLLLTMNFVITLSK